MKTIATKAAPVEQLYTINLTELTADDVKKIQEFFYVGYFTGNPYWAIKRATGIAANPDPSGANYFAGIK